MLRTYAASRRAYPDRDGSLRHRTWRSRCSGAALSSGLIANEVAERIAHTAGTLAIAPADLAAKAALLGHWPSRSCADDEPPPAIIPSISALTVRTWWFP